MLPSRPSLLLVSAGSRCSSPCLFSTWKTTVERSLEPPITPLFRFTVVPLRLAYGGVDTHDPSGSRRAHTTAVPTRVSLSVAVPQSAIFDRSDEYSPKPPEPGPWGCPRRLAGANAENVSQPVGARCARNGLLSTPE